MDIKELIESGESQSLEFKESMKLKDEIGETVSAFSNLGGGTVIVGVSDRGGVLGVDIGKNTLEEFANYIKRNTDPQIFPSVKILEIGGKNVVMVEVEESREKPVFFKNHAHKRVGKTNQMISAAEIRKLAREEKRRLSWDEQICEKTFLEDIDEKKIRWFVREAGKQRRLNISEDAPIDEVLVKLKLLTDRKLTNVAVLLFSRESTFLQSEVKCIRFSGNEPVKPYIDFQTLEGTVFDLVDGAEDFVLRNINNTTRYTATRDLGGIVNEGIFDKIGEGKRDLRYVLIQNAAKMRQKMRQKGD